MGLDNIELTAAGLGDWPSQWTGPLYEPLAEVVGRARAIASDFRDRAAELRKSGDLTNSGLGKQLDLLASQELDRLDTMAGGALAKARRDLEVFSEKLAAASAPPADSAGQAIREAECRALLSDLPESERIATLSEAVAAGDDLVLRAVFQGPTFWRARFIMPAELLEQLRERWQQGADPVLAKKVRDLGAAITKTVNAVRAARGLIASTKGLSPAASESIAMKVKGDPLQPDPLNSK